ncbi:MAG TPA: valine--tRNA ligase [Phycisphaerales bacterium]|nr:valine--tRNA ligase [Phycisphaerales bacterium]
MSDMHTTIPELPKAYKPSDHEDRIRERWNAAKAFHADPARVLSGEAEPYCVVIPPPNVTAALHLGHALNNTLQDVLVRSHRMMGYEALWMPGTDHAGIATQAVVEKRLRKEGKLKGALKQAYSRDAFVAEVQSFKDEYEAVITGQLKKMGCSCDWDRQRFTMDDTCARAVREAFFRLFQDGLIYRGKRLVNWDPALQTAVADDECYDEEVDAAFYYLRYPLVREGRQEGTKASRHQGSEGEGKEDAQPVTWEELARRGYPGADGQNPDEPAWITVATTRPETYLGDSAVAVNPHDPRAKALRGLFVELPLVGRVIPILEDSYVVLPKEMARNEEEAADPKAQFATGFLKVTPAHDGNDYEIGRRHSVEGAMQEWSSARGKPVLINMLSPDGRVSDKHGWSDVGDAHLFVGMKREEARTKVVEEFKARGLLEKVTPYRHSVKHSDRSKAVIEPYLSDQWYVKVTDERLAGAANRALGSSTGSRGTGVPPVSREGIKAGRHQGSESGDGALAFHPERYAKTYEQWHDGIRDWCISRQLWWGHRIPVWYLDNLMKAAFTRDGGIHAESVRNQMRQWLDEGRIANKLAPHKSLWDLNSTEFAMEFERTQHALVCCVRDPEGADRDIVQYLEHWDAVQDPDVLDTWFSSGLWPMSTMGWPNPEQAAKETGISDFPKLLEAFNPTSTLCTAREIITLWVSRMVMFNRYFMGEGKGNGPVPFRDVFVHAVIQDGEGRKMSKSLGNGVDPLDIIATHGADAMRFTVCSMATNTQDVRLPVKKDPQGRNTSDKFDAGRNFCNKLWNAARFAVGIITAAPNGKDSHAGAVKQSELTLIDRWMLSRLENAAREINQSIKNFEFAGYAQTIYSLLWNDFCDWYLEGIKPTVAENPAQRAVLRGVLDAILRLLHPIAPYVTEAVYETVKLLPVHEVEGLELTPPRKGELLCTAGWPRVSPSLRDEEAEKEFVHMQGFITAIREVRAMHNVAPKRKIVLHMPGHVAAAWESQGVLLSTLAGLERMTTQGADGVHTVFTFEGREYAASNLADASTVDAGAEVERLKKVIADCEKVMQTLEGRLANPGYAQKAPPKMVQETKDQLAKAIADRSAAADALKKLGG